MRHSETKTGNKNGELRNVGLQMEIIKNVSGVPKIMSHTQNYRGSVAVNALTKHIKKSAYRKRKKELQK